MAKWQAGDIVVELASTTKMKTNDAGEVEKFGPRNSYFHLRTFAERFRGRFQVGELTEPASAVGYTAIPTIPGIHIVVNEKRRTIKAVDPLNFPENANILRQANKIREPYEGRGRPWDERVINNATPTEIKTCLFELREFVDDGQAEIVSGTLPESEAILAMEGNLNRRIYAQVSGRDGKVPPVYATEEELERMGQPQESRVKIVPAGE